MPIPIEEFATPTLQKIRDRYPMSYDKKDRYNEVCPRDNALRYVGDVGREGGWKLPGYNPNHQTTSLERINVRTEDIQIRPY